ncbi:MAG TPA: MlaE family lipid ABC transporter permease subunit [bacterium]|nr:MlaE family lipid ABC transporter permease subunit [bacterium]
MNPKHNSPSVSLDQEVLTVSGDLVTSTVADAEQSLTKIIDEKVSIIDGSGITEIDSSGAVFINKITTDETTLRGFSPGAQILLKISRSVKKITPEEPSKPGKMTLERFGGLFLRELERATEIAVLIVDIVYWSIVGIFDRKQYRKGSFTEQAFFIGSTALPIVGTILFLIGVILTLQSAAQLRQFGVTVFVVNLVAIGLSREFAPLMTAIIVSGRSGSAIASEIATMKFTEELDAIKTLGLNPIRFVVVPKFWAMIVTMPLLSIMALFIGLLGGFIIAITYMDLSPSTFMNQLLISLMFRDIVIGLIKAVSFAFIIVIVGTYRGLNFSGGADGVGRATTSSVVTSIFVIIIMDSIWGILFYFKF